MNPDDDFVYAAQYARLRGVNEAYISQLMRAGRLVTDADGLIAVGVSDALISSTRLRQPQHGAASAKAGHPWANTNRRPLSRDHANALQRLVAETMLHAANALAPRVAELTNPADCRAFLAQELNRAATKITAGVQALNVGAAPSNKRAKRIPTEIPMETDQ